MLSYIISAIPEELADIWYVYDLILIAIIVLCVVFIKLLRKRSNLSEGNRNLKNALKNMRLSMAVKQNRAKVKLITAKNLMQSADYYYGLLISERDMFELGDELETIQKAEADLDAIIKNHGKTDKEEVHNEIKRIIESFKDFDLSEPAKKKD